jgi:hypothetical protein
VKILFYIYNHMNKGYHTSKQKTIRSLEGFFVSFVHKVRPTFERVWGTLVDYPRTGTVMTARFAP